MTDHAFWLGRFAFDYCIEFRVYGYNISIQKRKIEKEKILMLPYYPVIRKEKYQGLPFPDSTRFIFRAVHYTKLLVTIIYTMKL